MFSFFNTKFKDLWSTKTYNIPYIQNYMHYYTVAGNSWILWKYLTHIESHMIYYVLSSALRKQQENMYESLKTLYQSQILKFLTSMVHYVGKGKLNMEDLCKIKPTNVFVCQKDFQCP
jgi:hypothetical protein